MKSIAFWCLCVVATLISTAHADKLALKTDHPEEYVVKPGDTLWNIAGMYLDKPWRWPELWKQNSQIRNPDLIYPGDILLISNLGGMPSLTLKRAGQMDGKQPIPTVRYEAIKPFLKKIRIVTQEELDQAAYVLSGMEGRLLSGAGDNVHIKGMLEANTHYAIYQPGEKYVDPITKEELGLEALEIAEAKVIKQDNDIATIMITSSQQEIQINNKVLPLLPHEFPTFQPSYPENISGNIIAVLDGVKEVGQFNIVVINRGARDGVVLGNVFAINKKAGSAKDPVTKEMVELPGFEAGQLIIFQVFEKLSYGLVLKSSRPLAILDEIAQPI